MGLADKINKAVGDRVDWELEPMILLCPNTPKPMHGLAPRVVLGKSWWNKTRQAAYKSTNYHCKACGVYKYDARSRKWLEGHELYSVDYLAGRWVYERTVPLCHFCHNYIHSGRLFSLLQKGEIYQAKYVAIIQHGDGVLAKHNINKPEPYSGPTAHWSDWRMVLDGVEHESLWKDIHHWAAAHDIVLPTTFTTDPEFLFDADEIT